MEANVSSFGWKKEKKAVNIHANGKSELIYNANDKQAQLYRRLLV